MKEEEVCDPSSKVNKNIEEASEFWTFMEIRFSGTVVLSILVAVSRDVRPWSLEIELFGCFLKGVSSF